MYLKNKKTGEHGLLLGPNCKLLPKEVGELDRKIVVRLTIQSGAHTKGYKDIAYDSLMELNKEWEDFDYKIKEAK